MERRSELLIPRVRIMDLAMELATQLEAHDGMCKWLGPYENDDDAKDDIADYYKQYFEERVSHLLLTLSLVLRKLDDRHLIDEYTKTNDPQQVGLGSINVDGTWKEIDNLRTVCSKVIHASEVIPNRRVVDHEIGLLGATASREIKSFSGSIVFVGVFNEHPWSMRLNLRPFCDIAFRVAESL